MHSLYIACVRSVIPIVATRRFFDIATREGIKNTKRNLDFSSFFVTYGNRWQNKTHVIHHVKDPILPMRLFGKSTQQGLRTGLRLSLLEGLLFLLYHTAMGSEKPAFTNTLLPAMVMTLVLCTALANLTRCKQLKISKLQNHISFD